MELVYPSKDQIITFFQSHTDFFNVIRICELLITRGNVQPQEIAHIKDILHELKAGDFLLVENEGRDIYNERFSSTPDRIKRYFKNITAPITPIKKTERKIFYSWQSDLPNATNRGFIENILMSVAGSISDDASVGVEPVIDRDTKGVAGSPDIASTIFSKIDEADIVVLDVSIIDNTTAKRRTPNPNVLVELGYALKSKGYGRVILVFNRAYGDIIDLPFDLRTKRLTDYHLSIGDTNRSEVKTNLTRELDSGIRAALELPIQSKSTKKERPLIVLNRNFVVMGGLDGNHIIVYAKNVGKETAIDVKYHLASDDSVSSQEVLLSHTMSPNETKEGTPYRYTETDLFRKKLLNPKIVFTYKDPDGEIYTSGNFITQDNRADGFYNILGTPGEMFK
jgi:hypothetical protein